MSFTATISGQVSVAAFNDAQNKAPYYLMTKVSFTNGSEKLFDGTYFLSNFHTIEPNAKFTFLIKQCFDVHFQENYKKVFTSQVSETCLELDDLPFDLELNEKQQQSLLSALNTQIDPNIRAKCQAIVSTYFKQENHEERTRWLLSAATQINKEPEKAQINALLNALPNKL